MKTKVGLMFGGKSGEHEVSLRSAASVRKMLDARYQIVDIFVDKNNKFDIGLLKIVEVVFPVIHGTYGEDGCLQGMLEMLDIAYVGCGVTGSAIGMDKDVQKRLLEHAGISVAKYQLIQDSRFKIKDLKYPVFVKPANMGSSVGVSKVNTDKDLKKAIDLALEYDTKVMIEEFVEGQEIEVSVLGNDKPIASLPGRVIPTHEFYDYDAKYIDANGARFEIPTKLPEAKIKEIQRLAIKTFQVLGLEGMARVDMFLRPNGELVINEVNTIPGFTSISMYPKLWEVSGLSYPKLLDRLIELALEQKTKQGNLKRSYC